MQLLAINDLHGHLEPSSGSNGLINSIEVIEVDSATGRIVRAAATNQVVTRNVARAPVVSRSPANTSPPRRHQPIDPAG